MNNMLVFDLSPLSEKEKALYQKLLAHKGRKINVSMLQEDNAVIQSLAKHNAIFIGSKGGVMVFTSQRDLDLHHPSIVDANKAQLREEGVDRHLRFKEVQEMLIDLAQKHGVDKLAAALERMIVNE
ncbi:hypothetical protein P9477_23605 [Enterobacter mori]|uniref:hypothetical protein n=1 Tax=Enterobacter mori TaxID=539813 RepID=UPI00398B82F4